MSFSSEVKNELSYQMSSARHCQIAELAAIISLCGKISISVKDTFAIRIHTENIAVARKCFTLLKKTFNIKTEISMRRNRSVDSNVYSVVVKEHDDARKVLEATKLINENNEICENLSIVNNMVIMQECCKRAFIRGAFLTTGSISDPEKFYHFEIVCATEAKAEQLQKIIKL